MCKTSKSGHRMLMLPKEIPQVIIYWRIDCNESIYRYIWCGNAGIRLTFSRKGKILDF